MLPGTLCITRQIMLLVSTLRRVWSFSSCSALSCLFKVFLTYSLSLSLSHTHTHTHRLQVVCGYVHTLALIDEGLLYDHVWGSNICSQLETRSKSNSVAPLQVAAELGRSVMRGLEYSLIEISGYSIDSPL